MGKKTLNPNLQFNLHLIHNILDYLLSIFVCQYTRLNMYVSLSNYGSGFVGFNWRCGLDLKGWYRNKPEEPTLKYNFQRAATPNLVPGPQGFLNGVSMSVCMYVCEWKKVKLQCIPISSQPYGDKQERKSDRDR